VLTCQCVSSLVLFVAASADVVIVVTAVDCVGVNGRAFDAVLFAGGAVVVASLGGNGSDVARLAFGVAVFDAIITAFTAAILAFKLDAFSHHFFLLLRLPCPGPGMLNIGLRENLRYWCWVLCYWCNGLLQD
jgi:hypothetical protein